MYHAISGRKMLPLNCCQDSDRLEMHGMLVIYYKPPTPTELHLKCKDRLVFFSINTDSRENEKSKTGRDGGCNRGEVRSFPESGIPEVFTEGAAPSQEK